jgi:hypothetical protein
LAPLAVCGREQPSSGWFTAMPATRVVKCCDADRRSFEGRFGESVRDKCRADPILGTIVATNGRRQRRIGAMRQGIAFAEGEIE